MNELPNGLAEDLLDIKELLGRISNALEELPEAIDTYLNAMSPEQPGESVEGVTQND